MDQKLFETAQRYVDLQPIQLTEICADTGWELQVHLCDDIRALAAYCVARRTIMDDKQPELTNTGTASAEGTWQSRLQQEYVELKTKLGALASHLENNAEDLEHRAKNLLVRQLTAMKSYLSILEERLNHHGIAVPGAENSNGEQA